MDFLSIALALFFLVVSYILFERYVQGDNFEKITEAPGVKKVVGGNGSNTGSVANNTAENGNVLKREVVYTQDYYPWWRSTRWWNYDGWLYQKPYYNYWRRPYYYNYFMAGRPLILDGKRYYQKNYQ